MIPASTSRRIGMSRSSRVLMGVRIASVGHRLPLPLPLLSNSYSNPTIRLNPLLHRHSSSIQLSNSNPTSHSNPISQRSQPAQSRNHSTTSSNFAPATATASSSPSSPSPSPSPPSNPRWEPYNSASTMTQLPTPLPADHSTFELKDRKQLEQAGLERLLRSKGHKAVSRAKGRGRIPAVSSRIELSSMNKAPSLLEYEQENENENGTGDQISVEPLSHSEINQLLPNSANSANSANSGSISSTNQSPHTNEIASNLFSPALQGTSLHSLSPKTSASSATPTPSKSSDSTYLPDTFSPSPKSIEMLAVLKGSLAANLTTKSHKLFTEMRKSSIKRLTDMEKSISIFTDSLLVDVNTDHSENRSSEEGEEEQLTALSANQIVEGHESALLEVERFHRAYDSPLDLPTYNLMIGAYLLKASNSSSVPSQLSNPPESSIWFQRAWNLFQDMSKARNDRLESIRYRERKLEALRNDEEFDEVMKRSSPDPAVDASTIATVALGLTRLSKFNSKEAEKESQLLAKGLTFDKCFNDLIHSMSINEIKTEDLIESPSLKFNFHLEDSKEKGRHPSLAEVLEQLQFAAVRLGRERLAHSIANKIGVEIENPEFANQTPSNLFESSSESDQVGRSRSQEVEELVPVRASSKGAIKGAIDNNDERSLSTAHKNPVTGEIDSIIPYNLLNLKESLSKLDKSFATTENPYERQLQLEISARDAAEESLRFGAVIQKELDKNTGNNPALTSTQIQSWMWEWYLKLSEVLKVDIERMKKETAEATEATEETYTKELKAKAKRAPRKSKKGSSKENKDAEQTKLVSEEETAEEAESSASKDDDSSPSVWTPEKLIESQIIVYLSQLKPSKLALVTVLDAMRLQGAGNASDGIKTARALLAIGKAVELEIQNEVIKKTARGNDVVKDQLQKIKQAGVLDYRTREILRADARKRGDEKLLEHLGTWTQSMRAKVGSYLLQHFMEVATIERTAIDRDGEEWREEQPAMYSSYQYLGGKKLGVIKLNDAIIKKLDKESLVPVIHPRHLPMLVPPKPWLEYNKGGYLTLRSHAMRYKDSVEQEQYLATASQNKELEVVLSGLDVLGQTPWRINGKVFSVMSNAWNKGEGLADLPPIEIDEPEPQKPEDYNSDLKARGIYLAKLKAYNLNKIANHSQRCDTNYKLEIARAFLGETIYFPHNMDFRGRAYPIPPNLNHIGNDVCRGLMLFNDAKKLGKAGLKWLRIHIANLQGFDKASFSEREQFSIDNEALIRDSANNPTDGQRWWTKADDPWQCLSACFELNDALNHPDGPEEFESRLPVHQDGTCNGLQHYAALGGDLAGAKQVNLASGDRPSDVYTGIADLVIEALKKDAKKGNEYAILLEGKVTRKVVKQTVMTTVYGVTFIGAKNQVQRQLADRGDVPVEHLFPAAIYLARIIMNCIGDLFSGAEKIQDWLSESAKLISRSIPPNRIRYATMKNEKTNTRNRKTKSLLEDGEESEQNLFPNFKVPLSTNHTAKVNKSPITRLEKEQMTSVIWTTPLGLPVVQPYRKPTKKQVSTSLQTVFIADPNANSEVSPQKQASAFPPNFIHSLDATHMILTALECCNAGLSFASVHDSYWTHACDIETMSDLIRETFVRLHSQPILEKLKREFEVRYEGYMVPIIARDRARASTVQKQKRGAKSSGSDFKKLTQGLDPQEVEEESIQNEEEEGEEVGGEEEELEGTSDLKSSQAAVEMSIEEFESRGLGGKGRDGTVIASSDSTPSSDSTGKRKRVSPKNSEEYLQAKFVLLKDALPDIPKKGSFRIDEIKNSQYFFS